MKRQTDFLYSITKCLSLSFVSDVAFNVLHVTKTVNSVLKYIPVVVYFLTGTPDGYIVGGEVSEKGRWPWVLSMTRLRDTGNFTHTCGAALLTPDWILTAAHCVDGSE